MQLDDVPADRGHGDEGEESFFHRRPIFYILRGHEPVPVSQDRLCEWLSATEGTLRHLKADEVGPYRVSTIFLMIDHSYCLRGPPVLFETMVFIDRVSTEYCMRYHTWNEAMDGHAQMCERLRSIR